MQDHNRQHTADAALADLGPYDEAGTPDEQIERCDCGTLFRTGGWHRCENGERVEWEDYTNE